MCAWSCSETEGVEPGGNLLLDRLHQVREVIGNQVKGEAEPCGPASPLGVGVYQIGKRVNSPGSIGSPDSAFRRGDCIDRAWSRASKGRGCPNMITDKPDGGHACACPLRTGTGPTTTESSICFSVRSSSQSKSFICMENAFPTEVPAPALIAAQPVSDPYQAQPARPRAHDHHREPQEQPGKDHLPTAAELTPRRLPRRGPRCRRRTGSRQPGCCSNNAGTPLSSAPEQNHYLHLSFWSKRTTHSPGDVRWRGKSPQDCSLYCQAAMAATIAWRTRGCGA